MKMVSLPAVLAGRWLLVLALCAAWTVRSQSALPPEVQERLQRLNGLVEDLLDSQASLQRRLVAVQDELAAVREESRRAGDLWGERFATREELRKLAEAVRELDRKREEDKRLILEEIKKLAQALPPPPAREMPRPPARESAASGPLKGYVYTIQPGDTLSAIAQAYARSGVKVTVDDLLKANPNLNPNRLRVGQEVFIPDPNLK